MRAKLSPKLRYGCGSVKPVGNVALSPRSESAVHLLRAVFPSTAPPIRRFSLPAPRAVFPACSRATGSARRAAETLAMPWLQVPEAGRAAAYAQVVPARVLGRAARAAPAAQHQPTA